MRDSIEKDSFFPFPMSISDMSSDIHENWIKNPTGKTEPVFWGRSTELQGWKQIAVLSLNLASWQNVKESKLPFLLRRLATVSSSFLTAILKVELFYRHCLTSDATIMLSQKWPIIGKQVFT